MGWSNRLHCWILQPTVSGVHIIHSMVGFIANMDSWEEWSWEWGNKASRSGVYPNEWYTNLIFFQEHISHILVVVCALIKLE